MKMLKELIILFILAIPFAFLGIHWNDIPNEVPLHWNSAGEIDRVGSKMELIHVCLMVNIPVYLILLAVPYIDPKKKVSAKLIFNLRLVLQLFMSAVCIFILLSSAKADLISVEYIFVLIGLLFSCLGLYFRNLKPNYFIGIRTPWTLEDDTNWYKTHKMGGYLWIIGGLAIKASFFIVPKAWFMTSFFIIIGILVIVPMAYSFLIFKRK